MCSRGTSLVEPIIGRYLTGIYPVSSGHFPSTGIFDGVMLKFHGLNFSVTPSKIPVDEIVAATELASTKR